MQLAANATIAGRFRLNRPLGRGAMGTVWHATHLGLDIPCAVKFIEGEHANLPEAVARFEREAKSAAKLQCANVVQILDYGVSEGTPYIAMELLDGEDLGKRLERLGRLAPIDAVRIARDVCRALTRAHAEGVVHRDLKPDNIFLVKDLDREIAKVLDFGIAKASTPMGDGAATQAGALLGTPYYMSPEQVRGQTSKIDARSDLWSLGVIVFQCLTGRLPFEAQNFPDLLVKITHDPLPVPSEIAPDLPRRFDLWWARASQREPEKRFQSAKDMEIALALAFGFSPLAGKSVGGTLEMPMTDDDGASAAPRAPTPAAFAGTPRPMGGVPSGSMRLPQTIQAAPPSPQTFARAAQSSVPPPPQAAPFGVPRFVLIGGAIAIVLALFSSIGLFALWRAHEHAIEPAAPPPSVAPTIPSAPSAQPTESASAEPVAPAAPSASAAPSADAASPHPHAPGRPPPRRNDLGF